MTIAKRRKRAGRFNKIFDAFMYEQTLKSSEFTVENNRGTWQITVHESAWRQTRLGAQAGRLLWKKDGHIWCSIAQGSNFPAYLALCIRAARVATGENCFFSRNGVVYFKSVLLEVPYGTEFKIPNRGETAQ